MLSLGHDRPKYRDSLGQLSHQGELPKFSVHIHKSAAFNLCHEEFGLIGLKERSRVSLHFGSL